MTTDVQIRFEQIFTSATIDDETPYVPDFNRDFINKTYDWDAAMQRASGEDSTFSEVGVKIKILCIYISYVLHLLLIYAYIDLMHKS